MTESEIDTTRLVLAWVIENVPDAVEETTTAILTAMSHGLVRIRGGVPVWQEKYLADFHALYDVIPQERP